MSISLCLITKDEERVLAQCLASASPYVDEIVVVDTGSRDRTVEIARQAGARVSFYPWGGDFAAARNAALDQATGDWFFSLDADEVLDPGAGPRLREIVQLAAGRLCAFSILVRNLHDREEVPLLYRSYAKRLAPRHPRIRWTRPIHEQITHLDGDDKIEHVLTDQISITHYGYRRDIWEGKSKAKRNFQMLQQAIAENPTDAFNYYNLGQEHYSARDFAAALSSFEQALGLCQGLSQVPTYFAYVYALATGACVELRRLDQGAALGEEGVKRFDYADLFCNLGSCYLLRGDFDRAVALYQRASGLNGIPSVYSGDVGSTTWRPAQNLGDAYSLRGDLTQALGHFQRAIGFEPDRPYPRVRIASNLLTLGRVDEARAHLLYVLDRLPDHEEATIVLAECGLATQNPRDATSRLTDLITRHPTMARARSRLADLLADTGQLDEARALLAAGLDLAPQSGLLQQRFGVTLSYLRQYADAAQAFTTAIAADPADLRSQVGLEAARILSQQ